MSFSSAIALQQQLRRLALLLSNANDSSSDSTELDGGAGTSSGALDVQSPMNITVVDIDNNNEVIHADEKLPRHSALHATADALLSNENNSYPKEIKLGHFPPLPDSRASSVQRKGNTNLTRNHTPLRSASATQYQARNPTENELYWVTSGLSIGVNKWDEHLREYPELTLTRHVRRPTRSVSAERREDDGKAGRGRVGSNPDIRLSSRSPPPPPLPSETSRRGSTTTSTVEDVAELRHRLRILKSRYENQLQKKKVEEGKVARLRRPAPSEIVAPPLISCPVEESRIQGQADDVPSHPPPSPSRVEASFIGNSSMRSTSNHPFQQTARSSSAPASPLRQRQMQSPVQSDVQPQNSSSSDDVPSAILKALTTRPISRRFSSSAASTGTFLRPELRERVSFTSETARLRGETSQSSPRSLLGPRLWAVYGGDDDPQKLIRTEKRGSGDSKFPAFIIDEVPKSSLLSIPEADSLLTPRSLLDDKTTSFININDGEASRPATLSLLLSKSLSRCLQLWERSETHASFLGARPEDSEEFESSDDISPVLKSTAKRNGGFSFRSSSLLTNSIVTRDGESGENESEDQENDTASWPLPATGRKIRRLLSLADAGSIALLAQRAIALINADSAVRNGSIRVRTLRAVRSLMFTKVEQVNEELSIHLERLKVVSMEEESQRVLVDTFGPTGKARGVSERQHMSLSAAAPSAAYTLALLSDLKLKLIMSAPFMALKKNAHLASALQELLDRRCTVVATCGLKLLFARQAFASALNAVRLSAARAIHVSSRLASTKRLMASWHLAAKESAEASAREAIADRRGRLSCLGRAFRALKANFLSRTAQRQQAMLASVWSRGRMLAEAFRGWSLVVRNNKAIHERMDAALLLEQKATRKGDAASKTSDSHPPPSATELAVPGLVSTPSLSSALRILKQTSVAEPLAQKYKNGVFRRQFSGAYNEDATFGVRSTNNNAATMVRNIASAARGYALRSRQRRGLEETIRSLLVRSRTNFESAASLLMLPSLTSGGGVRGGATASTVRAIDAVLVLMRKSQGNGERLNAAHVRSVSSTEDRLLGALGNRFRSLVDALLLIRRNASREKYNNDGDELLVNDDDNDDDENEKDTGPLAANQAGAIRAAYASTRILDPVLVAHAKIEEHKEASLHQIRSRPGLAGPHQPLEISLSLHSHGSGPLWTRLPRSLLGLPAPSRPSQSDDNDEVDILCEDRQLSDEEKESEEDDPALHFNVGSDSLRMRAKALAQANRLPHDWTHFVNGAFKARADAAVSNLRQPIPVNNERLSNDTPQPAFEDVAPVKRSEIKYTTNAIVTPHKILSPLTRRILSKGVYMAQALQVNVSPVGSVDSSPAKAFISEDAASNSPSISDAKLEKTTEDEDIDEVDQTISARAVTLYAFRLLKAVLRGWAKASRTCKLSKKLRAMWIERRQRGAFIIWKRYHEERKHLIDSVKKVGCRVISRRYFLALKVYLNSLSVKREKAASLFNRRRILRSTFNAFQSFAASQRRNRALCAIADASNVKRLQRMVFTIWKGRFISLQPIRAFSRRMARINGIRAARLFWPAWRNLVDRRKLLRRVFSCAERRQNEQIAYEATRHSRAFVALAETLHKWSDFAKEETIERKLRAAEYTAEAFWRMRRLVKAVITWKQSATVAMRARNLRQRCLRKCARIHLRAWIGVFLKHRAALLRLQMRWEFTVPRQRTLFLWRQMAHDQRAFKYALAKRLLRRWHFSTQATLRGGFDLSDVSNSLRHKVLALDAAVRLKRSFSHWKKRVTEWARVRALHSVAVTALADRKKRAVLVQLAAWAERRKDLKKRIKEAGSTPLHLVEKSNPDLPVPLTSSSSLFSPAARPTETLPISDITSDVALEALDLSVVEPPAPRLRTILVLPPQHRLETPSPSTIPKIAQSGIRTATPLSSHQKASVQPLPLASMSSIQQVTVSSGGRVDEVISEPPAKVTVSTQTSLTPPASLLTSSKAVVRAAASIPLFPDYSQRSSRISPTLDSLGSRRGSDAETDSIDAGERPRAYSVSSTSSLELPTSMNTYAVPPLSIMAFHPEFLNSSPEEERFRFWARKSLAAERVNLQMKPSAPPPPPPSGQGKHEDQDGPEGRGGREGSSGGFASSVFASIAPNSSQGKRQQALETSLTPHDRSNEIILDRISSRIRESEVEKRVIVLASRVRDAIAAQEETLQGKSCRIVLPFSQPISANLIASPPGILTASLLLSRGENVDDDLDSLFEKPVIPGETEDIDSLVKEEAPNDERFRLAQAVRDATNRVSDLLSLTSSRLGSSRSNESTSLVSDNTIKEDSVSRATSGSVDSLIQSAAFAAEAPVILPATTSAHLPPHGGDSTSRALNFEEAASVFENLATPLHSSQSYSSDSLPSNSDQGSNSSPLSVMKVESALEKDVINFRNEDVKSLISERDSIHPLLDNDADSLSSLPGPLSVKRIIFSDKQISVDDHEVELEEAFGDQDVSVSRESEDRIEEEKVNKNNTHVISSADGFSTKSDSLESTTTNQKQKNEFTNDEKQSEDNADKKQSEENAGKNQFENNAENLDVGTITSDSIDVRSSSPTESMGAVSHHDKAPDSIANASRRNSPDSIEKTKPADQQEVEGSSVALTENSIEAEGGHQLAAPSLGSSKDSLEGSLAEERDSLSTSSSSSSSLSPPPLPQPVVSLSIKDGNSTHESGLSLSNEQLMTPQDSVAVSASVENDSISYRSTEISSFASPTPLLPLSTSQEDSVSGSPAPTTLPTAILNTEDRLVKEVIEADVPYLQSASAAPSPVRTSPKVYYSLIEDEDVHSVDVPPVATMSFMSVSISDSNDSLAASVNALSEDSVNKDFRVDERYNQLLLKRMMTQWRASAFLQCQRRGAVCQRFERLSLLLIKRAKAVRMAECELYALSIKRVEAEVKALYARKAAILNSSMDEAPSITAQSISSSDSLLSKASLMSSDSLMFQSPISTFKKQNASVEPTQDYNSVSELQVPVLIPEPTSFDSDSLHAISNHFSGDSLITRINDSTNDTNLSLKQQSPEISSGTTMKAIEDGKNTSPPSENQQLSDSLESQKLIAPVEGVAIVYDNQSTSATDNVVDVSSGLPSLSSELPKQTVDDEKLGAAVTNTPLPAPPTASSISSKISTTRSSKSSQSSANSRDKRTSSESNTVSSSASSRRSSAGSTPREASKGQGRGVVLPLSSTPSSSKSRSSKREKAPPVASPSAISASTASSSSSSSSLRSSPSLTASVKASSNSSSVKSSTASSERGSLSVSPSLALESLDILDQAEQTKLRQEVVRPMPKPSTVVPQKDFSDKYENLPLGDRQSEPPQVQSERSGPTVMIEKSPPTIVRSQRKPLQGDTQSQVIKKKEEEPASAGSQPISAGKVGIVVESPSSSLSSDSLSVSNIPSLIMIPAASPDSLNISPQIVSQIAPLRPPERPTLSPDSLSSRSISPQKLGTSRNSPDSLNKVSPNIPMRAASVSPSFVTIKEEDDEDEEKGSQLLGGSLQVSETSSAVANTTSGLRVWSPPPLAASGPLTVSSNSSISTEVSGSNLQSWVAPPRISHTTSKSLTLSQEASDGSGIAGLTTISDVKETSTHSIVGVPGAFPSDLTVDDAKSLMKPLQLPQNDGLLVPPGYVALLMPASRLNGGRQSPSLEGVEDETVAVLVPTPSSADRLNNPRIAGTKSYAGASSSNSAYMFSPTTMELLNDIRGVMRSSE